MLGFVSRKWKKGGEEYKEEEGQRTKKERITFSMYCSSSGSYGKKGRRSKRKVGTFQRVCELSGRTQWIKGSGESFSPGRFLFTFWEMVPIISIMYSSPFGFLVSWEVSFLVLFWFPWYLQEKIMWARHLKFWDSEVRGPCWCKPRARVLSLTIVNSKIRPLKRFYLGCSEWERRFRTRWPKALCATNQLSIR